MNCTAASKIAMLKNNENNLHDWDKNFARPHEINMSYYNR